MDLTERVKTAFERLYEAENGISFPDLNIDNVDFLALYDAGYITEPDGEIIESPFERFPVHEGKVFLTYSGRAVVEKLRLNAQKELDSKENERCKEAKEKAQKKRDRIFDFLLVMIGAILTLLVEHISEILAWISAILHR